MRFHEPKSKLAKAKVLLAQLSAHFKAQKAHMAVTEEQIKDVKAEIEKFEKQQAGVGNKKKEVKKIAGSGVTFNVNLGGGGSSSNSSSISDDDDEDEEEYTDDETSLDSATSMYNHPPSPRSRYDYRAPPHDMPTRSWTRKVSWDESSIETETEVTTRKVYPSAGRGGGKGIWGRDACSSSEKKYNAKAKASRRCGVVRDSIDLSVDRERERDKGKEKERDKVGIMKNGAKSKRNKAITKGKGRGDTYWPYGWFGLY